MIGFGILLRKLLRLFSNLVMVRRGRGRRRRGRRRVVQGVVVGGAGRRRSLEGTAASALHVCKETAQYASWKM